MANIEINLDFLIRDCLKAYTEETLEFEILPPARSATGQYEEFPGQLLLPEHILSFDSTEELSHVTPAVVSELPLNNRFICRVCSKPYRGKLELTRHMKKHSSPNKYSCTVEGCVQTMYRIDAMRSHIKLHEKRFKTEMERKRVVALRVQS
jgi:uncharacterized Zn-finger protein